VIKYEEREKKGVVRTHRVRKKKQLTNPEKKKRGNFRFGGGKREKELVFASAKRGRRASFFIAVREKKREKEKSPLING